MITSTPLRIGTRDSQLAVWQATLVKIELQKHGVVSELIFIKSEGDIDLATPLYEIGIQGIFTKTLDAALLNKRIDIAVHSMKDVPTQLAKGLTTAAVLPRANYKDIFVFKEDCSFLDDEKSTATIATSSVRRIAQWLHKYPNHTVENLRGNVNTRLQKINDNEWHGAIFAAAGLERIQLRPQKSIDLTWMLPAPAQGAIVVLCREDDFGAKQNCSPLHNEATYVCTKTERDFLRTLQGGCSTPIGALAQINNNNLQFKGNWFSMDGKEKYEVERTILMSSYKEDFGSQMAKELLCKKAMLS
ncbi:MAG: hydroxymethylbilane synthase [Bacteroidota bacterium]|nr:hydroxymethylbilane synthase [Bacteroidota bacterium]